jgi:hypothetical protein
MKWIKRESYNKNNDGVKNYPFARWMSRMFLAASLLLLIYTYYRAEFTMHSMSFERVKSEYYFKYYLITLTGILFWGVVLRLREAIQVNIVTVVISLLVGLYVVEYGLTFMGVGQSFYQKESVKITSELNYEYDQRTKLEVIEDLIEEGVDAVPAVRPRDVLTMDDKFLPLGGISNKTTVGQNESGRRMIYLSDRYGFNNPDFEWDAKDVEWLLTGDSFTEGVAVEPGQDIAGQLRVISQESALNIGRSGNGPLMELAELTEYARVVKPRIVLWIYYEENDLRYDLRNEKRNPLLMRYMEKGFSQNLIHRQKEIDNRLEKYILEAKAQEQYRIKAKVQFELSRWIRLYEIRGLIDFSDVDVDVEADIDIDFDVDVDDPIFTTILTKAKAEIQAWGGELYFVYLPEYDRYSTKIISHNQYRKKSEVIEVVKGLNIPVLDIHQEVFADHPDPLALFAGLNAHYNADGYSETAKAILRSVNKY